MLSREAIIRIVEACQGDAEAVADQFTAFEFTRHRLAVNWHKWELAQSAYRDKCAAMRAEHDEIQAACTHPDTDSVNRCVVCGYADT